jgi:hypothetical protein
MKLWLISGPLLACIILLSAAPGTALAASQINAGLVSGVWFGSQDFSSNQPISVFSAVENQSNEQISGTVYFYDLGQIVGTTTFSVAPNSVAAVHISKIFSSGNHSFRSSIKKETAQELAYTDTPTNSLVVVTPPPPPVAINPGSASGGSSSSSTLQSLGDASGKVFGGVNPVTESIAQSVDRVRNSLLTPASTPGAPTHSGKIALAGSPTPAGTAILTTPVSPKNLFDVSISIAQDQHIPIWNRIAAIFLTICSWLVRHWVFLLIIFILLSLIHFFRRK